MPERPTSETIAAELAAQSRMGRALAPLLEQHGGQSGVHLLADPLEAFATRMLMALGAEHSLDVQYYIWRRDQTGTLLLHALLAAADRGVRVRLLLDDGGTRGLDRELAALAQHPRIEVRLFNPFVLRWPKPLGYLGDFDRLNRRMHNKSYTADNVVTIVGGRNVGDEYFGATDGLLFADLDVLAVGPVVGEVSADFDRYWASLSSWPADAMLRRSDPAAQARLTARAMDIARSEQAGHYVRAVRDTPLLSDLLEQRLSLQWSRVDMLSDDPAKGLGEVPLNNLLADQLNRALGTPRQSLALVSPYFVPTDAGTETLTRLSRDGVSVRILTNSWEATDVPLVHAGYTRHRETLLRSGVSLHEMRRSTQLVKDSGSRRSPLGSAASSLHAKTFAVDGERTFVGSFNFDPRSAMLNTELGFVIHNPALARVIERIFDVEAPRRSYRLRLSESGELEWLDERTSPPTVHQIEPGTSGISRGLVNLLSRLPIDWLL